ncbi:Retrovirus-related Pol polyprotein from transposon TNT 1-94 [Abeliophyllum distichum]|uniref:Retrovirus-related Pol polyprotein from transposon TNT 1-94 n=1 Tax=Abeliophyllum distichum TaxID=126358 RepID=A0ABD1V3I1_9LAMI
MANTVGTNAILPNVAPTVTPTVATTVMPNVAGPSALTHISHGKKPEKFNGVLLHELHAEKLTVSESFQVAAIIEKLPPSWRDFKNYLKHKLKEINLEELIVCLRIEEDSKKSERRNGGPSMEAKANMAESSSKKNMKRKHSSYAPKKNETTK